MSASARPLKLLVFTDSRGLLKKNDWKNGIFTERLIDNKNFNVKSYLCPMKWTTTLDFVNLLKLEDISDYDYIILYTGVVDWSPRKLTNAKNDIYNNRSLENTENLTLHTADFSKKIVNNKKDIFDAVFGETAMAAHFERPWDVHYEGEPTINMYGLDQAQEHLVPWLAGIPNLIFINANRLVPGWEGDYTRGRPANIRIVEDYSVVFSEAFPPNRIVNLLDWDRRTVQEFTCDNFHLTQAGSDWIYDEILARIDALEAAKLPPAEPSDVRLDRSTDMDTLMLCQTLVGKMDDISVFFKARRQRVVHQQIGLTPAHADQLYIDVMSFLYNDATCKAIAAANAPVKNALQTRSLVHRLYCSGDAAMAYVDGKLAAYRMRWIGEYQILSITPLDIAPYSLIAAYSFRAIDRLTPAEAVTVEFIYTAADDWERLCISLNSLARSRRAYEEAEGRLLTIKVTIVEAAGATVCDVSTVQHSGMVRVKSVEVPSDASPWHLLKAGVGDSGADLAVPAGPDFLFHAGFVKALADYLARCDWRRQISAMNVMAAEARDEQAMIYSAHSPSGFLWLLPMAAARDTVDFDEIASWDHLLCKPPFVSGLTIADTISVTPDCVVFRLPHGRP